MKPLVSILITAYNAEETIAYTLESAVAQTWQRKEIIVVDDGSTDRTAEVVRQFKDVKLVSTENHGLSGAQNNAFPLSQGDYIQYLDADDLLVAGQNRATACCSARVGQQAECCFPLHGPLSTTESVMPASFVTHCAKIFLPSSGS